MAPRLNCLATAACDSGHWMTKQVMSLGPVILVSLLALTTSAESIHVIGVWDDNVTTSLTEIFPVVGRGNDSLSFRTEYVPNITGTSLSDYLEAHTFIRRKHIHALIGSYNHVIATVASRARKHYFVTSPAFKQVKESPYVLELYPNVNIFSDAVVDLVAYYKMTDIGLIYDCNEGAVIMERLLLDSNLHVMAHRLTKNVTPVSKDAGASLSPTYEKTPVRDALKKMRDRYIRSFLVICTSNNTDHVLQQGLSLSIFSTPHNWLLVNMGQEDFDLKRFVDSRVNMTVLQMTMDSKAEDCALSKSSLGLQASLQHDALLIYSELYQTITYNRRRGIKEPMKETITKVSLEGCTGKLEFTSHGVREENFLQLKTLEGYTDGTTGTWRSQPDTLSLRVEPSLTYSRVRKLADDIFPRRPVQITAKLEPPFVQLRTEEAGMVLTGNDRFEGFCIDILNEIAALLNFNYNITLVPDGKFGSLKPHGWTGMVKELIEWRADLALAPFQITPERSSAVDFTKPFMTKGTTVVVKRPEMRMWIFQFLSPLSKVVWIAILVAVLVVSLVLFAVSKASTERTRQEIETLPGSFWYIWGSLLQGGLVGSPESVSARILASSWWFFSLIIISIYTANLAAFLTITVSNIGIDTAADLANQNIYDYGTVEGSQMESFFNFTRMYHYSKMWAHMSTFSRNSMVRRVEDGFDKVRKGGYAFIWDSPIVYHEMAINCDLMEIGSPFDLKGYGFAITKRAPFAEKLSWAILKLNDDGILYRLEGKWWRRNSCPDMRNNATTQSLELENVAGMFLVLLAGILLSLMLCLLQYWINQIRGRKKTKRMKAAVKERQEENHINSGDDDEIRSCHDSPIFLRPQFNTDPI